jgi:hypothetical protein
MQQGPSSRSIVYIVVNTPHGEDVGSELLRLVLGSGGLAHVEITDNPGKNLCLVMGNDGSTHVMTNALAVSRLLLERAGLGGLFVDRLAEATRRVILRERQLSVLARIARLEGGSAATATLGPWNYSDQTERVKRALEAARVKYRAVRTHADYYETPLAGRARFVGAKSEQNMLKMVLLKNDRDECFEPNALAVLVQYASSGFDTKTINVSTKPQKKLYCFIFLCGCLGVVSRDVQTVEEQSQFQGRS